MPSAYSLAPPTTVGQNCDGPHGSEELSVSMCLAASNLNPSTPKSMYSFNRDNTLYDPNEGFNKGNMFKNLYSKYKNYVYNLKVNNPKDELLYKIQMYSFALKDLNLYLDVYPEDRNMLKIFQEYKSKLEEYKNKYINEYGPLYSNNVNSTDKWTWINNPWPWDKGGN